MISPSFSTRSCSLERTTTVSRYTVRLMDVPGWSITLYADNVERAVQIARWAATLDGKVANDRYLALVAPFVKAKAVNNDCSGHLGAVER